MPLYLGSGSSRVTPRAVLVWHVGVLVALLVALVVGTFTGS